MRALKFVSLFLLILVGIVSIGLTLVYLSLPKSIPNQQILILGKGGEGHTAPDLTDTMMIAYLNHSNKNVKFLPLPRDLWIKEIRAKLNSAYHYGGIKMINESVVSVTGTNITNTIVVNFSLFTDLINAMGGIKVNVLNSFIDEKYPIAGKENDLCNGDKLFKCRYETVKFDKGFQLMDGSLALKYVRSRNSVGDEGTDLAREKRQQQVISAIKDKLFSPSVILNPKVIINLYKTTMSHLETDLTRDSVITIIRIIIESRNNISFLTFPEDKIVISQNDKKYDRQYVFIPTSGSWKDIQEWIAKSI